MSYKLITIAGVPVKIHWTFGLLLLFVLHICYSNGYDARETFWYVMLVLIVFVFVIMHEFGHILVARKFGVSTQDVIVSPIGGVARLRSIPKKPKSELLIALGGPAVNVLLAIIFYLILALFYGFPSLDESPLDFFSRPDEYFMALLVINIALVLFNMVPAFPMDGGRVLRAGLTYLLKSRLKATFWAASLGQLLAVVFLIIGGIQSHYVLMFIAVFIFVMARREYAMAKLESLLNVTAVSTIMKPLDSLMVQDFSVFQGALASNTTLTEVFYNMSDKGWYNVAIINEQGNMIGSVDREVLMQYIEENQSQNLFKKIIDSL